MKFYNSICPNLSRYINSFNCTTNCIACIEKAGKAKKRAESRESGQGEKAGGMKRAKGEGERIFPSPPPFAQLIPPAFSPYPLFRWPQTPRPQPLKPPATQATNCTGKLTHLVPRDVSMAISLNVVCTL